MGNTLKELNAYGITGLYYEMWEPSYVSFSSAQIDATKINIDVFSSINNLFWKNLFEADNILKAIESLKNIYQYTKCDDIHLLAILNNSDVFVSKCLEAVRKLGNINFTQNEYFYMLETVSVLCKLYSKTIFFPHNLTVEDGFILNEFLCEELLSNVMDINKNPYLDFIQKNCEEVIKTYKPDVLWILGPIKYSNLAIALIAKKYNPNIHISVCNHSSEYYSLNKITDLLLLNDKLFNVIDSVILDDTINTKNKLLLALKNKTPIDNIPNIIYKDKNSNEIRQTEYEAIIMSDTSITKQKSDYPIVNIKLWENDLCHWNKCTFCGINKKYQCKRFSEFNDKDSIDKKVEKIKEYVKSGYKYFWFIDEAIPVEVLKAFSEKLIKDKIKIIWQARARIDKLFNNNLCETLSKAGLKEIRFGLESACSRILKLMNKFPDDITLESIENIVKNLTDNNVSVHFPLIVGFPTETSFERMQTYNFVEMLRAKYKNVTFNVNRIGLDVCSTLFKNYYEFGITRIDWPCNPRYFLGNIIEWNSKDVPFDKDMIDRDRNDFMRRCLYPWIPDTALIKPHVFYRLTETSRNTLLWKCNHSFIKENVNMSIDINKTNFSISKNISYLEQYKYGRDYIYNWNSHILLCDEDKILSMLIVKYNKYKKLNVKNCNKDIIYNAYKHGIIESSKIGGEGDV